MAAVAAESAEIAEEACSLIRVEYEPLPTAFTPEEAMAEGASAIHEEGKNNHASEFLVERGDVDTAFKEADALFEETFDTHMVHQAYIEPTGVIGQWNKDGTVTVRGPLQSPFTVREFMLAPGLGMPQEKIQVIQTRSGGAFGGKLDVKLLLVVAFLAKEAGRPVQILLSQEEDISTMRPRVPARFHIRSAFAGDGKLLGKKVDVTADNGAYSSFSPAIAFQHGRPDRLPVQNAQRPGDRAAHVHQHRAFRPVSRVRKPPGQLLLGVPPGHRRRGPRDGPDRSENAQLHRTRRDDRPRLANLEQRDQDVRGKSRRIHRLGEAEKKTGLPAALHRAALRPRSAASGWPARSTSRATAPTRPISETARMRRRAR